MSSAPRRHGPGFLAICIALVTGCRLLAFPSAPQGPTFAGPAAVDGTSLILGREALAVAAVDAGDGTATDWMAALPAGGLLVRSGEDGALAAEDAPLACALAVLRDRGDRVTHIALALRTGGIVLSTPGSKETEWRLEGLQAAGLAAGDIDGDGIDDLLAIGAAGGIFASLATGEEGALSDIDATAIATGGFLGRRGVQVAVGLESGGLVLLDLQGGGSTVLDGPRFTGLTALDIDGDGIDEVIGIDGDGALYAAFAFKGEIVALEPDPAAIERFEPFLRIQLAPDEPPEPAFLRGDANLDETVDLSDAVAILGSLFLGAPIATRCRKALDANDSAEVDISDPVYILSFLFLGGPVIPPPYPTPGPDPTPDLIPCDD